MSRKNISENIAELRRERGVKQEDLARAVGVTPQAVSKWECGGTPDSELLPAIADYFRVSIDALFGRKVSEYGDITGELVKNLAQTVPFDERIRKMLKHCMTIERGLFFGDYDMDGHESDYPIPDHSQVITDEGMILISLTEKLPYCLVMPEPGCGWRNGLENIGEYVQLFAALADGDLLNVLYLLNSKNPHPFTHKHFANITGLELERAREVLQTLIKYKFITTSEVYIDDTIQTVYTFRKNPAFVAVLALCTELIKRPGAFYGYMGNDEGQFFK